MLQWRVLRTLTHDIAHYTQGLELHEGKLFESAGLYGRSALYIKELETGTILRETRLAPHFFAEGITIWRDRVMLLTWLERIALVFDLDLVPVGRHTYSGQGWGLTHDAAHLIMSDGSATLRYRHPDDFRIVRELQVTAEGRAVDRLNELEYARGLIFANVWKSDRIAAIDPADGRVRAWLDLAPLKSRFDKPAGWDEHEHVLNGIAHDPASDRFYVTGKCWPVLFELDVAPLHSP
ncbi:Glutamine cyclotransferase [Fontimonas thermophila]|uniref:Glutamine cyclotransferase n=2 Tax=Fontimonas thermophila TaxID=1076937 RepID=A0A1I2K8M2_9GAMM|nr:Glutamine cyclotransferase [Fontimonas thermophila]